MSFQTFDPPSHDQDDIRARVAALRARLADASLDGFFVPHEDAHQSEYLPPSEERLAHVTGFTGSSGYAIILADDALFATDGRYTVQAERQVPADIFTICSEPEASKAWLKARLPGVTVGFDPNLHTRGGLKTLTDLVPSVVLTAVANNPVDAIWTDRPVSPDGPVRAHPPALAGKTVAEKLDEVRGSINADALLIAASDSVTWLFNWRGSDVSHTPLVLSRAFIPKTGKATVFVDAHKLPVEVAEAASEHAHIANPEGFLPTLARLSEGLTVEADLNLTSEAALRAIEDAGTIAPVTDPTVRQKAIKNPAEIAGMRAAHQRDGIAMTRFLAWLDQNAIGLSEIDLVKRLEGFRREAGAIDVSFDTIAGSGPHGAIVHYRVDKSTNRTVGAGEAILIDSGGQYPDGTTDITRTVFAGEASDEFRVAFTRVLKGHIAIARQAFPEGASGAELDTLARAALWNAGRDYAHGTGHGVGAALAVHEGPAGISRRSRALLAPGMILSNEPGDYPGAFGIRIENLVLVRPPRVPVGGRTPMLSFETISLAPIDTRLVIPALLTAADIAWLDCYHARVHGALVADLPPEDRDFLEARCRPLVG